VAEVKVTTLDAADAGTIELKSAVFEAAVRADVMHEVVRWQLAKRRQGTHSTRTRGEIRATTKKMYKQKGTGRARHGAATVTQFRGGAKPFGPKPRDHAHDLPKKVRAFGLRSALSAKLAGGQLVVLDEAKLDEPKTKGLAERFLKLGWGSVLVIGGEDFDRNFKLAAQNLPTVDLLPSTGANVYDILKRDLLVLTRDAVQRLEARLG
jgi:large subunit ribosomal protein L4